MTTAPVRVQTGRIDPIQEVLKRLRASSPEVRGVALVSVEGFIASSLLPNDLDEDVVAGMAAVLLGATERVTGELIGSEAVQTTVRCKDGTYFILTQVSADAVLVVLASGAAKQGVLFLDIKRHLTDLESLI